QQAAAHVAFRRPSTPLRTPISTPHRRYRLRPLSNESSLPLPFIRETVTQGFRDSSPSTRLHLQPTSAIVDSTIRLPNLKSSIICDALCRGSLTKLHVVSFDSFGSRMDDESRVSDVGSTDNSLDTQTWDTKKRERKCNQDLGFGLILMVVGSGIDRAAQVYHTVCVPGQLGAAPSSAE
ncbi:hypothetical protein HAX54_019172, partial [Datura stramonium]|nr:hypothetical protein [Datura stramonium]